MPHCFSLQFCSPRCLHFVIALWFTPPTLVFISFTLSTHFSSESLLPLLVFVFAFQSHSWCYCVSFSYSLAITSVLARFLATFLAHVDSGES